MDKQWIVIRGFVDQVSALRSFLILIYESTNLLIY
jgi:hypothetical protein